MKALAQLKERMAEIEAIHQAGEVLSWDQQTYMPPGGAAPRAVQMAALSRIRHEMTVSGETMRLLDQSEREGQSLDPGSDDAAFLRVARRDYEQAARLPTDLVTELTQTTALAYAEWTQARSQNNFARFQPWLERILDLTRRVADHLGHTGQRYDALLDQYEPGMTAAQVQALFEVVKPGLLTLTQGIAARGPQAGADSVLRREFPEDKQRAFGEMIVAAFGFDLARGRQDQTVHPFCTSFTSRDVRITTRFDRRFLPTSLFGSMHETGHALYEQGVAPRYDGSVLGGGTSLGVHESQSRLWENLVGRSRPFWQRYYPQLQAGFAPLLDDVDGDRWYRAINHVAPSLIRVEADEVTYNLHILLRFEMELDLLEGRLSVADAPSAWNAKMQEYLGLTPPDDACGILQDVHWSSGGIGYFPTYFLGNMLSVQLFQKADADLGGQVHEQIGRGDFAPLRVWLQENVYQWGRKFFTAELVQRVTGGPLDPMPYLRYLQTKFGALYGLDQAGA